MLADRLLHTLQERVRQRQREELMAYVDELVPEYAVPAYTDSQTDDKAYYRLPELLARHDEDFVRNSYRCLLKREVDAAGLQSCMQALQVERCSRIELLGRLRYSEEGVRHGVHVRGLRLEYLLARLQGLPAIGPVVSAVTNVRDLWGMSAQLQCMNTQLHSNDSQLAATQESLSSHIQSVVQQLGSEAEAVESRPTFSGDAAGCLPDECVALSQVLALADVEFVQWCHLRVHARLPCDAELSEGVQKIATGSVSKIAFLGGMTRAAGITLDGINVTGLSTAYRMDRLENIPLLGFFIKLPRCLLLLSRLDTMLEYQGAQISRNSRRVGEFEARLMSHYNSTVRQVKREIVDALRSQGN